MWMWEESSDENVTDDEKSRKKQRNGCNFFVWIDPKTCSRGLEYAKIMQAKKEALEGEVEELKMKIESLERGKQIMEEENEALVVKMADLTEANVSLQAQIEVWKTEAKKSRLFRTCLRGKIIVVVVLLSIIVFVIDFCVELGVEVAPWESSLGIGVVGIVALPLPLPLAHDAADELDG
ncbi:hypothetical protein RHMOL_Rhmol06G0232400 [Rhododendron molle]|uniref:Uncharacterized protein n=1 Tax=Rhododendron molle TaxID=49168 RepID=A0ACC0NGN9_RHOML|nr:hypothetical protein RHMOL_Rhmol06G0232400 [Rhododendron molle]